MEPLVKVSLQAAQVCMYVVYFCVTPLPCEYCLYADEWKEASLSKSHRDEDAPRKPHHIAYANLAKRSEVC